LVAKLFQTPSHTTINVKYDSRHPGAWCFGSFGVLS